MFKLVVLFALAAFAAAKPSGLGYSAIVAPAITHSIAVAPSAVSSTYRKDIISEPVVAAYSAPAVVAAPVVQNAAVYAAPVAVPAAVSHTYRSDVISQPIIAHHAAPVLAYSAHVPSIHAW